MLLDKVFCDADAVVARVDTVDCTDPTVFVGAEPPLT